MKGFGVLLRRELALAWGKGGGPLLALTFYACVVVLLPMASGRAPERLAAIAPGIAWLALALAALLSLERLFERDYEDGALDLLAMGPAPLEAVAVAKCLAQWLATGAPLALAAGTLLGAAFWLLLAALAFGELHLPQLGSTDWVLGAAGIFACLSFIPYFELQRVAGPVYLSQIGYVMAATSLAVGTFIFGERYGLMVWLAAGVIVAGILLVNRRPVRT